MVVAIVITVLVITLNSGSSQQGGAGNSGGKGFGTSAAYPQQTGGNVVTVNENKVDGAQFAYTYDAAYGHFFAVAFNDGSETVMFMAVLPEKLCRSGASFSGNSVSGNGILFDIVVSGSGYNNEYNSIDNPEVFDNLSVEIPEVEPYRYARFSISGTVSINGRRSMIRASGESEYKTSGNSGGSGGTGGTGGTDANACYSCGGTGKCNICHGSGTCQICLGRGGLSVPTYGVEGAEDWVVCEGCHGGRSCSQCSGGLCSTCGGSGRR